MECTSKLTALLKHDLLEISDHLFAQGLISEDIREQLTLQTVEEQRRASRLVSNLTDRVKTNPSIFKEFVSVLKALGPWTQDIVKDLEEVYAKNREGTSYMLCVGRVGPTTAYCLVSYRFWDQPAYTYAVGYHRTAHLF